MDYSKTLAVVSTSQDGKKRYNIFRYLNPDAPDEYLEEFAQRVTALTNHDYSGAIVTTPRDEKTIPVLSLGSWSSADTVYSVPVTYTGDGALSVSGGSLSDGVLTVEDEDGSFNGFLYASEGASFADSSLYFDHSTQYVTISGGGGASMPQYVTAILGSQFVPTVDNDNDLFDNADGNIQFFDSKLNEMLNGGVDYAVTPTNSDSFLWGGTTVSLGYDTSTSVNFISSSANNTLSLGTNNSTVTIESAMIKLSEVAGLVYRRRVGTKRLVGVTDFFPFNVASDGLIAQNSITTICSASVTISGGTTDKYYEFTRSILNPNLLFAIQCNETLNSSGVATKRQYYRSSFAATGYTGFVERAEVPEIGTWTSTGKSSSVDSAQFVEMFSPALSFSGDNVTISKGDTPRKAPAIFYEKRIRNSSGTFTEGGDFVAINPGYKPNTALNFQLTTISGGVASTLNSWLEDDDNVILGFFPNETKTDVYAVTYKPGTYSKSSWLNDAFSLWDIDFKNLRFIKSTKQLPDVLGMIDIYPHLKVTATRTYSGTSSGYQFYISFSGKRDGRTIQLSGTMPTLADISTKKVTYSIVQNSYSAVKDKTTIGIAVSANYFTEQDATKTGSKTATATITLGAKGQYISETTSVTWKNCYSTVSFSYTVP